MLSTCLINEQFSCLQSCPSPIRLPHFHTPHPTEESFKTQTHCDHPTSSPEWCLRMLLSTEWCVSSPTCLSVSVTYHSLPSGSLPAPLSLFQVLWDCPQLSSKPWLPIFCHICICSSFCLECLLHVPTLSVIFGLPTSSLLQPLFSTRLVGKVIFLNHLPCTAFLLWNLPWMLSLAMQS